MTPSRTVRLLISTFLLAALVLGGATVALGSHYDDSQYDSFEKADTRVDTYGGPRSEQRAPGASGVSFWTESILHAIPEDESVYMKTSVTYRPMISNCGPGDIDVLGVDRNNTYEGERHVDEDVTDSIKSFSEDADSRDRYERNYGDDGRLTTTDWQPVERFEVEWYDRDDLGASVRLFHEDRFVTAQRECYSNPDDAGWYRTASIVTVELENGTTFSPDEPTYSHWFWICDCADREEAVETLGPPPSETDAGTPTPTRDGGMPSDGRSTPASDGDESETTGGSDDSGASPSTPAADASDTATPGQANAASRSTRTPAGSWEHEVVRTPTEATGPGFGPLLAVVALVALATLARRR